MNERALDATSVECAVYSDNLEEWPENEKDEINTSFEVNKENEVSIFKKDKYECSSVTPTS